jgi:hypothetical protein
MNDRSSQSEDNIELRSMVLRYVDLHYFSRSLLATYSTYTFLSLLSTGLDPVLKTLQDVPPKKDSLYTIDILSPI